MNRHVPHSGVAPDPKLHKQCHHCGGRIVLQRPAHRCTKLCTDHAHVFEDAELQTITRYFDDFFNEMCEDCAKVPAENRKRHRM